MKMLLVFAVTLLSLSTFAKDLTCRCNDRSTSTLHELNIKFANETAAKVTLSVTNSAGIRDSVCQANESFVVSKVDAQNMRFAGTFKCPNQKPARTEIKFNAATMSLPEDSCHKDTIFHCRWNG